jgi:hypothetical protein
MCVRLIITPLHTLHKYVQEFGKASFLWPHIRPAQSIPDLNHLLRNARKQKGNTAHFSSSENIFFAANGKQNKGLNWTRAVVPVNGSAAFRRHHHSATDGDRDRARALERRSKYG